MTENQEDFAAGRLEFQKKLALDSKKIRSHLIKHPGSTIPEITDATGLSRRDVNSCVTWLIQRAFIKQTQMGLEVVPL